MWYFFFFILFFAPGNFSLSACSRVGPLQIWRIWRVRQARRLPVSQPILRIRHGECVTSLRVARLIHSSSLYRAHPGGPSLIFLHKKDSMSNDGRDRNDKGRSSVKFMANLLSYSLTTKKACEWKRRWAACQMKSEFISPYNLWKRIKIFR